MQSRRVITAHEKRVVAYHEAGHALCSELLPSVERVHRISIIPRGQALGYTLNLPEEDRYLKTKDELLDYMVVLLGGRVTEHLVFGQVTTGASDDLRKVHEISRSMVTQYGMGTELQSKQLPSDDYSMSDHTRRNVDEEQQYLTDLAHRRALKLVAENRHAARGLRLHAARERGAGARGHRPDRGGLPRGPEGRTPSSWCGPRADPGRPTIAAADAARISPAAPPPCSPPRRSSRGAPRCLDSRPVFERIDHIGVAVADLDGAIELYRDRLGMPLQHRETVEQFGVEAVLLGVGDGARGAAQPHGPRERASAASSSAAARACTTWPTRPTTSKPLWTRPARRACS